jgi:signal transduction histidine kinase
MERGFANQRRHVTQYFVGQHRRGGHQGTISVLLVAAVVGCLLSQSIAAAPAKEIRRVLILNLLDPLSSPDVALLDQAIVADLENGPYQIELYTENLQTTLFADDLSQQTFRKSYIQKYFGRKLDVIITVGPDPLKFMAESHEVYFPGIPVAFAGSTEEMLGGLKLDGNFTGVWGVAQPEKTLDTALRLQPGTKHVVVVGGTGTYDRYLEAIAKERFRKYEGSLDFTYLTDLDLNSLLERLKHLPSNTIVYHTSMTRDGAGVSFIDATQAVPLIAGAAKAPVFVVDDVDIGKGTVGGYVLSFKEQGQIIAGMVMEILHGKKVADIPIVRGFSTYMFDWREMRRWGLKEKNLPPGSVVLYRKPTRWERAKRAVPGALAICVTLACLIGYLLFKQKQLWQARKYQRQLSGMLINAQEQERSRIASDLHDDFSQRLAVLALDLETFAETIPESPEQANRLLHELLDSASEMGADLHTLSHRLHSSTLERLGLVPGVSSFCKEFAAQQGIKVDFTHEGIPRSVPPDVALCLFRLVQEGLRNLKKHSGASEGQVSLKMVKSVLHLSICDQGVGFEVNGLSNKEGLGIRSMRERVHLVGGRFEIISAPHKGTKIDVWVRIHPAAILDTGEFTKTSPEVKSGSREYGT